MVADYSINKFWYFGEKLEEFQFTRWNTNWISFFLVGLLDTTSFTEFFFKFHHPLVWWSYFRKIINFMLTVSSHGFIVAVAFGNRLLTADINTSNEDYRLPNSNNEMLAYKYHKELISNNDIHIAPTATLALVTQFTVVRWIAHKSLLLTRRRTHRASVTASTNVVLKTLTHIHTHTQSRLSLFFDRPTENVPLYFRLNNLKISYRLERRTRMHLKTHRINWILIILVFKIFNLIWARD